MDRYGQILDTLRLTRLLVYFVSYQTFPSWKHYMPRERCWRKSAGMHPGKEREYKRNTLRDEEERERERNGEKERKEVRD